MKRTIKALISKVFFAVALFPTLVYGQDTTLIKLKQSLDTVASPTRKAETYLKIAGIIASNNSIAANSYLDSAMHLLNDTSYAKGNALLAKAKGVIDIYEGDYADALHSLGDAQIMFKNLNDSAELAKTYLLLGNIYSQTDNNQEALRYYRNAGIIFEDLKDYKALAAINNNLGTLFWQEGKLDSASFYLNRALMSYIEMNDKESLATIYTNIGIIYADKKDYAKAIEYYQKSNTILEKLNQTYGQSINYLNISDAYMQKGEYKKAQAQLNKSIHLAETNGYKSLLPDEYYTVGEIKEKEGNYKEAINWYKKAEEMKNALIDTKTNKALLDVQTQQLEEIQKREIARINEINNEHLKSAKLKNTLLLVVSGSVLLLMLVATLFFYKRAKIARQINEQNIQILNQKSKIYEQAKSIAEINETLLEKNAKLEKLNEEKNYIMNVVAHDLKSPLNQIQGLAEVIRLEEGKLSPTQLECLENISVSSERLSKMINRILDTRAIESEKSAFVPKDVNLKNILEHTIDNFKPLADQKKITLQAPARLPATLVKGDKQYIQQVLENILSNAIKFSPTNKKVAITLNTIDNQAVIGIKDEGPGLTEDDKKKLFVEYAKLSAQPTGGESSTGLGLSIVKKYIDLMEGDIWCESTGGQGATFYLAFNLS